MKKEIRCAIYTRKSTEEGLEQDFNSLDAQREAGIAYIKSQMHEGWVLVKKEYNDGGYSGGNMERPAFKELLKDIQNNEIDIVVVYKVDRLTRSLMDFSKIIEIFDKHNASFVSITQHFNTTTSMGRLTLNILLSFAQFEREVTSERIKDKFEASRKKGLWISGSAPYGYLNDNDRVLKIDPKNYMNVERIFKLYLELGTIEKLQAKLKKEGICTKNNKDFSRGNLYRLLSHKAYIGKITYKNKEYESQHQSIVSVELFNEVQEKLKANAVIRKYSTNCKNHSLLAGKIFNDNDLKMYCSHSNKKGKKYRYYVSNKNDNCEITKISAGEIENFAGKQLKEFLKILPNENLFQEPLINEAIPTQKKILEKINEIEPENILLDNAINKVKLNTNSIDIEFDINFIFNYLKIFALNQICQHEVLKKLIKEKDVSTPRIILKTFLAKISLTPKKENKIIISNEPNYNQKLINAVVQSFWFNEQCALNKLSRDEKTNGNNKRFKDIRFLPPNIIEDILNGQQDSELNIKEIIKLSKEYSGKLKTN